MMFSYLVRTDPRDVARVESKTVISTKNKRDVVPAGRNIHPGALANWISPEELDEKLKERFPNCMQGMWKDCFQFPSYFD